MGKSLSMQTALKKARFQEKVNQLAKEFNRYGFIYMTEQPNGFKAILTQDAFINNDYEITASIQMSPKEARQLIDRIKTGKIEVTEVIEALEKVKINVYKINEKEM